MNSAFSNGAITLDKLDKKALKKYLKPMSPIPTGMNPGGKLTNPIQCILFDIYGTLFISGSGDIGSARGKSPQNRRLEKLLEFYRIDKSPQQLLRELYRAVEKTHGQLRQKHVDFPEVQIDLIWQDILKSVDLDTARKFAVEFELIVNPVYPMPHLEKVISGLRNRNILMGIISNAQFYTAYLFVWFLGVDMNDLGFDANLTFFSYQYRHAKPSLLLFNKAAEKLAQMGIEKKSVLYIGNDMLNDIYPAYTIGFHTALFAGDARSLRIREDDARCKGISSDLILTDLLQLLDYIS